MARPIFCANQLALVKMIQDTLSAPYTMSLH